MPETEPAGQTVFTGLALADKDTGPNSQVVIAFNVITYWRESNYERTKSLGALQPRHQAWLGPASLLALCISASVSQCTTVVCVSLVTVLVRVSELV